MYDKNCRLCDLHGNASNVCIPGEGPLTAKILVLGQAPNETDDQRNRSFVGRPGHLLRMALKEFGFVSPTGDLLVRVENPVRCFPPGNRKPTKDELKACHVYSERLAAAMPGIEWVVALGETAMRACKVKGGVLDVAGTPKTGEFAGKPVQVFPLTHPSYCLRNPPYMDTWEEHWRLFKAIFDRGDDSQLMEKAAVECFGDGVPVAAVKELREIVSAPEVALDIETTHLDRRHAHIRSFAFSDGNKTRAVYVESPRSLDLLRDLSARARRVITQGSFDAGVMTTIFGTGFPSAHNTELMAARVEPALPRNLGALVVRHAPEFAGYKGETEILHADGTPWATMPADALLRRNALDAYTTFLVHKQLLAKMPFDALAFLDEDAALAAFVDRIASRGLYLDTNRMLSLRHEAEEGAETSTLKMKAMLNGTGDFNPASVQQVIAVLESLGIPVPIDHKKGSLTTNENALVDLIASDTLDPDHVAFLQELLTFRGHKKVLGTYVKGYAIRRHGDGYVRSRLRFPGTVSWRLNSRDPNLQNVPRGPFRQVFTAGEDPDWLVGESDYGQAEFREAARVSGDPNMLLACSSGDPHALYATELFGAGFTKPQRYTAKVANFLQIYLGGPKILQVTLAKGGTLVSFEEACRYNETFHRLYAKLVDHWQEWDRRMLAGEPICSSVAGYSWKLQDFLSSMDEHSALDTLRNASIQSVPPRLSLRAGLRAEEAGVDIRLQTHDGLIFYGHKDQIEEQGRLLRSFMEEEAEAITVPGELPIPASLSIGKSWGEQKEI